MKYAIIEDGIVVNIAVADAPLAENWIEAGTARRGDLWDGTSFSSPPSPPTAVPFDVTMRQARLALSRAGKLADAEAAIAGMAGAAGEEARIEWEYASTLRRDHPLIQALGPAIGLDAGDLDALFISAAQIG
ncbi:MAG: hypothetical protein RH980_16045 [Roseovarius confluentis]|jgi:hypothetical protein